MDYDIVISGAGPVGLCMAIALSSLESGDPPRVLLLDAGPKMESSVFDDRRFALSRSSMAFFNSLGLWSNLSDHTTPIKDIRVWQAGRLGYTHLSAAEEHLTELGVAITFRELGKVLAAKVALFPNIELRYEAEISALTRIKLGWTLEILAVNTKAHQQVDTKLLVVAEGARSQTRQKLGISADIQDYQQTACVLSCYFESNGADPFTAYECFTNSGSLAILPGKELAGQADLRWLIWALPHLQVQRYQRNPEQLLQLTQEVLGQRLRVIQLAELGDKLLQYRLMQCIALEQVRPHMMLIGNAAHSLHPIAGQGLNLALRDISLFFSLLKQHFWPTVLAPSGFAFLQQYAAMRAQDQHRIQIFCDQLVKGFRRTGFGVQSLRSLGLLAFDLMPGAKKYLSHAWLAPTQQWQEIA